MTYYIDHYHKVITTDGETDDTVCFYCGTKVRKGNAEKDRFPIPQRHGGEHTVAACISCHDLKDRFSAAGWPMELWIKVMNDFPKLNRETRIFIAKAMGIVMDSGM